MRTFFWKSRVLAVGLIGLGASLSSAADGTLLFNYSKVWQYNDAGTNFTTAWRGTNFPDSAWPSMPGVFLAANEPGEMLHPTAVASGASLNSTLLQRMNSAGTAQVSTYYFRTHFNFTAPTNWVLLLLSNLVDDGAVFWLNGTELTRVHMPGGTVNYATYTGGNPVEVATAGDVKTTSVGGYTEVAVAPQNLVNGDNLLAVEVHDHSRDSSEVVFGMSMGYRYIEKPVITRHPANLITYSNQTASLSFEATGDLPMTNQWQTTSIGQTFVNIPNAKDTTYTFANAGALNGGRYRVIVSNMGGSVTSDVATVTVEADTIKPVLLSAFARYRPPGASPSLPYSVDMFFSENITFASATKATFTIKQANSSNTLTNKLASNSTNFLVLTVQPWITNQYTVSISNLTDRAGNMMETDMEVGITFTEIEEIVPINKDWRVFEDGDIELVEGNATPPVQPGSWKTNGMPAPWETPSGPYVVGTGPGVFAFSFTPVSACLGPRNTDISNGLMTYYFTTTFNRTTASPTAQFELNHIIDDGVIFYLNGAVLLNYNMPSGSITYRTAASSDPTATCRTNNVLATNLVLGVNTLSAELHQVTSGLGDREQVFGARLSGFATNFFTVQPKLFIARANDDALMYWSGPNFVLEYATNCTSSNYPGKWTAIDVPRNQWFESISNSSPRFWRLRSK